MRLMKKSKQLTKENQDLYQRLEVAHLKLGVNQVVDLLGNQKRNHLMFQLLNMQQRQNQDLSL